MRIMYDYEILWLQKYGGISRYFYEIIRNIKQEYKDTDVQIVVKSSQNEYFKDIVECKEFSFRIGRIINEVYSIITIIRNSIRKEPYDIVHFTYNIPLVWYKMLYGRKKTKIVITIHDLIHEKYMPQNKRIIKKTKELLMMADGIITVSESTKQDLLYYYPFVCKKRIKVIYHGNSFESIKKEKNDKLPSEFILFVGNREGYKNFSLFLEAFQRVNGVYNYLYLVCAGGGNFTSIEKKKIDQLNIHGLVKQFSLSDNELAYAYSKAVCFVFPSKEEGFGIPILEAWENNCPVALSYSTCFNEIAGEAAVYFDSNSADSISRALLELMENNELKEKIMKKSKQRVKLFSWEKAARETMDFYSEIIEN